MSSKQSMNYIYITPKGTHITKFVKDDVVEFEKSMETAGFLVYDIPSYIGKASLISDKILTTEEITEAVSHLNIDAFCD